MVVAVLSSLSLPFKWSHFQDRLGKQLTSLETRWTELISSVLQVEMANVALDAEIERLNKKEAELAEL